MEGRSLVASNKITYMLFFLLFYSLVNQPEIFKYEFDKITPSRLNGVIAERCGLMDEWSHNTVQQRRERQFLQKGVSFLTDVMQSERGLDLENAAMIFCVPGRDFCVVSGRRKWQFVIFEDEKGQLQGKCCLMPLYLWLWDVAKRCWCGIVNYARDFTFQALTGRPYKSENAITAGGCCPRPDCPKSNDCASPHCQACGRPLM